jgi:hypothetical protein
VNEDNLSTIRREASRHSRNKKRKYLKETNVLGSIRKVKNITDRYRHVNKFKKFYQLRTILVQNERRYLLMDSHNISNRWKNYIC